MLRPLGQNKSEATNGPRARKLRLGAGHRGLGRGHRRLVREAPEARRARTLAAAVERAGCQRQTIVPRTVLRVGQDPQR